MRRNKGIGLFKKSRECSVHFQMRQTRIVTLSDSVCFSVVKADGVVWIVGVMKASFPKMPQKHTSHCV